MPCCKPRASATSKIAAFSFEVVLAGTKLTCEGEPKRLFVVSDFIR